MTTIRNMMGSSMPAQQARAVGGMLSNNLTAAGTTQGTALALPSDFNIMTTVAASSGVILPVSNPTDWITVANHGANALAVYPPVGGTISTGATNAALSVPAGKCAQFQAITPINFTGTVSA